jgi:hypothetical protein
VTIGAIVLRATQRAQPLSSTGANVSEPSHGDERIASFEEFWPYYVGEHADKRTRTLHFVGTAAAVACLATAIVTRRPKLALGALVAGYGPAWVSHFFIEKNRPATFKYPAWSLLADFKMWGMIASGTMDAEVERVLAEREAQAARAEAERAPPAPDPSAVLN